MYHRYWLIFLIPLIFTSRLDGSQPDFVLDSFAMLLWVSSWLADFTPKSQCLGYECMFTIYQFYMMGSVEKLGTDVSGGCCILSCLHLRMAGVWCAPYPAPWWRKADWKSL